MESVDAKSVNKSEITESDIKIMLSQAVDQIRKKKKDVKKIFPNLRLLLPHINDKVEEILKLSLLHYAVVYDNFPAVEFLVDHGADVNSNISGYIPLHLARSYEVAEYLIQNGANIEAKNNINVTPSMTAFTNDNFEVMRCLIKNKADQTKLLATLKVDSDCNIEDLIRFAKTNRAKFREEILYDI